MATAFEAICDCSTCGGVKTASAVAKPKWRVGRKLGRTLYVDDQCVGMVDDESIAADIVNAMNLVAALESAQQILNEEGLKLDAERAADRALLRRLVEAWHIASCEARKRTAIEPIRDS